jgi:aminoglycoside phosphotransferase (APT) family kinase protein
VTLDAADAPARARGEALREQLPAILTERGPWPIARVERLAKLTGGASRDTWSFDAVDVDGSPHHLILQCRSERTLGAGIDVITEMQVLEAARAAGVPVARPIVADAGDGLGRPSLIVEHIAGETIPQRVLRGAVPPQLACQYGAALGRIHNIPVATVSGLEPQDPLDECRRGLEEVGAQRPALELGLRWLEHHRPDSSQRVVVHGDYRSANSIVGPDGLLAVIDWELAHLGDPLEDMGWLCIRAWRFGHPAPVGGFGTYEDLSNGYRDVTGRGVDVQALRWWQVLGTVRWAMACLMQGATRHRGERPSLELAVIGRRACEAEFDLMLLLP